MKRISSHLIGIDQGESLLFSDYENDGDMWVGSGDRERRVRITFGERFRAPPAVHLSTSLLDVATGPSVRTDLSAEFISTTGFDIVFRTWADSRVARIRAAWMAIGALAADDDWEL